MLIASTTVAGYPRRRGLATSVLCSTPARALGTALGLLLLVRAVNVPAAARQLVDVRPGWIAAGTALTGVSISLGMLSWAVLLRGSCARLEPRALVSLYLRALFVGQLLPGGVGGDAVRVVETGRRCGTGRALAAVVGGRLAGGLGIALWGAFAALTMRDRLDGTLGYLPAVVATALALAILLVLATLLCSDTLLRRLGGGGGLVRRVAAAVRPFTGTFDGYAHHPRLLLASLGSGVASWGVNLLALTAFAHAVGIGTNPEVFALVIPISLLGTLAPFSMNGFGLREGILVGLLAHDGIGTTQAASVSLLVDLQMLPFAVAGAVIWGLRRLNRPCADVPAPEPVATVLPALEPAAA
ncbi:MAG TPA: lysylphosphatidylglycerol synthase transmembrane domain-containing protein [Candidatus Dormibacteraeota bacterium]